MISRLRLQGFANQHRKPLFAAMCLLLLSYFLFFPILWMPPESVAVILHLLGFFLISLGCVMRIFSTMSIGGHKNCRIVTTEVYSICRNPLYFASFLMAVGIGLFTARPDFSSLCAAAYLLLFLPMMRNEANYLKERFSDYKEYERSVPLFFPNPFLWRGRENFEINFRLVSKTALDSSVAIAILPMLCFLDGMHGGAARRSLFEFAKAALAGLDF